MLKGNLKETQENTMNRRVKLLLLRWTVKCASFKAWKQLMTSALALLTVTAFYIGYSIPRSSVVPLKYMQRPEFVNEVEIRKDIYNVEYLSYANARLSRLVVSGSDVIELGEIINVTITVQDGYGRPRSKGGDLIRLWLRDIPNSACSAGHVIDHKNGTYTGTLKADWVGTPYIIAAIAGSRETVKIMYKVFAQHKTLKIINAVYISQFNYKQRIDRAPCLPSPDIPGYPKVCNFTAENYGLPWYCGEPRVFGLTCYDWQEIFVFNNSGNLPLTKEEDFIFQRKNLHTQLTHHQIQVQYSGESKNAYSHLSVLPPCNQRPIIDTWKDVSPVGFFYNWVWVPAHCSQTLHDVEDYNVCLKDRRVLIYGDSTTRQWFVHFRKILQLQMATENFEDSQPWHKPCLAVNEHLNYSVFWGPHEMPFYGGPNRGYNRPTYVYLDELPNNSRDIIVIHYYLHFVSFHPSVFIRHIRRLYQSVENLLSRAPNVTVTIKGPHAMTEMAGRVDDYWGPIYDNIIRETFRPLMEKIIYLDYWDMTVSSESSSIHPNDTIISNMVHYLLNMACREKPMVIDNI